MTDLRISTAVKCNAFCLPFPVKREPTLFAKAKVRLLDTAKTIPKAIKKTETVHTFNVGFHEILIGIETVTAHDQMVFYCGTLALACCLLERMINGRW